MRIRIRVQLSILIRIRILPQVLQSEFLPYIHNSVSLHCSIFPISVICVILKKYRLALHLVVMNTNSDPAKAADANTDK